MREIIGFSVVIKAVSVSVFAVDADRYSRAVKQRISLGDFVDKLLVAFGYCFALGCVQIVVAAVDIEVFGARNYLKLDFAHQTSERRCLSVFRCGRIAVIHGNALGKTACKTARGKEHNRRNDKCGKLCSSAVFNIFRFCSQFPIPPLSILDPLD